jgi:hypothetical protein
MKPCDNCHKFNYCEIANYLKKNYERNVWELNKYIYENYSVSIINMKPNNLDSIVLECDKIDYIKEEICERYWDKDYCDDDFECQNCSCNGGCKK